MGAFLITRSSLPVANISMSRRVRTPSILNHKKLLASTPDRYTHGRFRRGIEEHISANAGGDRRAEPDRGAFSGVEIEAHYGHLHYKGRSRYRFSSGMTQRLETGEAPTKI